MSLRLRSTLLLTVCLAVTAGAQIFSRPVRRDAYGPAWNGDRARAPSADAVYDQLSALGLLGLDPNIVAIAAENPTANQMFFWDGVGTVDLMTTTAYGRGLVGVADAPAARASLGAQKRAYIDVTEDPYNAVPGDGLGDATAIQAAIDAAKSSGQWVYFPPGIYDIETPLDPCDYGIYRGEPNGTVLRATLANTDAVWKWDQLFSAEFSGFWLQSLNNDANAFEHNTLTEYTAYCAWRHVEIDKSFHTGLVGCLGSCLMEDVIFGWRGVAGALWQPLDVRGGDANTNIFTNAWRHCRFYHAVGGDAAVELATGWNPLFDACIFEQFDLVAVKQSGVLGAHFLNCNFENIEPGGAYNCPVLLVQDALLAQGSSATFTSCKFQNNGGTPWAAVVMAASACGAGFEGCQGSLGGGYYLYDGTNYDSASSRLYYLRGNRTISYGGTASAYLVAQPATYSADIIVTDLVDKASADVVWSIKTVVKSLDVDDDASTDDFTFDDDAANMTEQSIDCGAIIPWFAEVISVQLRCIETVTGSNTMTIDVGTASGGAQLLTAAACDTNNELITTAAGAAPVLAATATNPHVWVNATPGVNWNTLNAGRWVIQVTYIDYGAAKTQCVP